MARTRVGIVGLGPQMMGNLIPVIRAMEDVEIVAVCDEKPLLAADAQRRIPGAVAYHHVGGFDRSADEGPGILDHELDAVVVAGPPKLHHEVALAAMKRDISVFVEKPPCDTISKLSDLVKVAKQTNCVTAVGMNFRYAAAIQRVREIVCRPNFGPIVHVHIEHYAGFPKNDGLWNLSPLRAFMLAQAIHPIDLAVQLCGGKPTLDAGADPVRYQSNSLDVDFRMTFENGSAATIHTGSIFPSFTFRLTIVGENSALISVDDLWQIKHQSQQDSKRWSQVYVPSPLDSGYTRSGYSGELQAFFGAIRAGHPCETSFASLLPTYEVIEELCGAETNVDTAEDTVVEMADLSSCL